MKRVSLIALLICSALLCTSFVSAFSYTTRFTRYYDMNDVSTQITDSGSSPVNWTGGVNVSYQHIGKIGTAVGIDPGTSLLSNSFTGSGFNQGRTGKFSVMGWIRYNTTGTRTLLQTDKNSVSGDFSCFLTTESSNQLSIYCGTYGVGGLRCTGNTTGLHDGEWHWFAMDVDGSGATNSEKLKLWVDSPEIQQTCSFLDSFPGSGSTSGNGGFQNSNGAGGTVYLDAWSVILGATSTPANRTTSWNDGLGTEYDFTFIIDNSTWNVTSAYANQTVWRTNTSALVYTTDTTPTVTFSTNYPSNCSIGKSNLNYSDMVADDSDTDCATTETTDMTCTLPVSQALNTGSQNIYVSCARSDGVVDENATSGPLAISMNTALLETNGRDILQTAIENSLSNPVIYTDQKIYVRFANNSQQLASFDKVAVQGNQRWAFNFITEGESLTYMSNLTPVLYVLEIANVTLGELQTAAENLITNTKR